MSLLKRLASDYTIKELASHYNMPESKMRGQIFWLMTRMGVKSRAALITQAFKFKLLNPNDETL